jgi:hypothetical protein
LIAWMSRDCESEVRTPEPERSKEMASLAISEPPGRSSTDVLALMLVIGVLDDRGVLVELPVVEDVPFLPTLAA